MYFLRSNHIWQNNFYVATWIILYIKLLLIYELNAQGSEMSYFDTSDFKRKLKPRSL